MDALPEKPSTTPSSSSARHDLVGLLGPGVVSLEPAGSVRFADRRALELLGCADGLALERVWAELKPRLELAGLSWNGAAGESPWAVLDLAMADRAAPAPPAEESATSLRRLVFDLRRDPVSGGVLLVHDLAKLTGLEADLRLTSQMRSVAQISPSVAHDLRAPINAMVFNLEILKEMIGSGRAAEPASRDKLLRYVQVLKEELQRLHSGLETFLAYISPRSDKLEALDVRDLAEELASLLVAPARKQQVQVKAELPESPVPAEGNRYLLRQALLHIGLAALAGVPRQGRLQLELEHVDGRARLRLYGAAGEESPAEPARAEPVPGFALRLSPRGAEAQLWVARAILAAHGGEARATSPAGAPAGGPPAYEVELAVLPHPATEKK